MDCDPTEEELEEQKLLMNANYESLLNSEQLLNLNPKQVNLLKSLANGQQQMNLMKKENLDSLQSNKLTKGDEQLLKKSIEQRFSPLSNKELNLQQASQKVILQHLQNKQNLKQNRKSDLSDQPIHSAPQSPSSVHSLQSIKSDLSTGKSTKPGKPSPSPRLNGAMQEKTNENHRNENSTIENRSPIASPCSPISWPLLNNVNGLFNHIDSSSLGQHLLNSQLQVPANHNPSSRTSSPTLNGCSLDSELLSKLSAFQQLLNQQQNSPAGQPSAGNMNSLISNLMNLNRNGTTPQPTTPTGTQMNSMSTLNLLNNLINGNSNLNNLASSQNSNSNQPPPSSSPSAAQSRNQLLNTLQKLNSSNNPNSSNSSFKDSSVNINNSNNSANSVSTVNSSSNGSKFNDSISNGPLSSPNNLNVAWPSSQTPPSMHYSFDFKDLKSF